MQKEIIDKLFEKGACSQAVVWAQHKRNPVTAWKTCHRGDWMLWLIGRLTTALPWSDKRKALVLATCECARLSLKYVPKGEERPRIAIETAEAWTRGEATREEVKRAAADAADAAAYAAAAAAYAADAAYAAAYAARTKTLKKCADIVRKHYPDPPDMVKEK